MTRPRWTPSTAGPCLGLLALVAVTAAVLSPVFRNGYVYDDYAVIVDGQVIHDPSNIPALFAHSTMYISPRHAGQEFEIDTYRPISTLTLFGDSALSGRKPWSYHSTNLLGHLITIVLLFFLARRLLGRERWPFALLATAWFALTPLPQASHIWISGRSDVLAAMFGLSCMLAWRTALQARTQQRWVWHALSWTLFALGLLSKEVLLLALPPLVMWPEKSPVALRDRLQRAAGLLVVGAAYLALRVAVLGGLHAGQDFAQMSQALRQLPVLQWDALTQSLMPTELHLRFLNYDYAKLSPAQIAAAAVAWGLAVLIVLRVRRRAPLVSWGLLWFACVLAPVSVITTVLWPGFGRYLYLPAIGLSLALGDLAARAHDAWPKLVPILTGTSILYLAGLALLLSLFVAQYRSGETLYNAAFQADPQNGNAIGWLGLHYAERGEYSSALDPLARAHQLSPDESRYLAHLGDAFIHTGQPQAAQRVALEGIARYGDAAGYFYVLMVNLTRQSNPELATENILECLRLAPTDKGCGDVLTALLTRDPLREQYRRLVRSQLLAPDMAALRQRVAPLINSLP